MEKKRLWNNKEIEVVKIGDKWYALDGWNGEIYLHCWETDENTFATDNTEEYEIEPVVKEDGNGNFQVIDYIKII